MTTCSESDNVVKFDFEDENRFYCRLKVSSLLFQVSGSRVESPKQILLLLLDPG